MTRRLPALLAAAALAPALVAAVAAAEPELRPALEAEVRFTDPAGAGLAEVAPGRPFRVEIDFRAAVGSVPSDLRPQGWLRQPSPSDLPCGETAAAWRAAGRGALGGVELNGVVLGALAEDGSFTIADPARSLGSANLLAARRFANPPAAMAVDPRQGEFLFTDPIAGEVVALNALGGARIAASGLDRPGDLVPAASGGAWVVERGSGDLVRLRPDASMRRLAVGARSLPGLDPAATEGRILAVGGDGPATRLLVVDDAGTEPLRIDAPGALDAALTADAALWLASDGLHLVWLDAPGQRQRIALPGRFDALAVSPEGRIAVVFSRRLGGFGLVDLAVGRMVQAAGTDAPVAEVAFLPGTAALRRSDQSTVGVIDLALVQPGREAVVGTVRLGPAVADPGETASGLRRTLLAPLLPEPALLAVHGRSYTGFVVDRRNAVSGKPPMEAVRLRGGVPRSVAALDRGLRSLGGGRFSAVTAIPRPGEWELVVSAGIGQVTFCARVPATPAPEAAAAEPGRLRAEPAGAGRIRLRLSAADDAPVAGVDGRVDFSTLAGNWRSSRPFATDAAGLTRESYALAGALPVVVQVRTPSGPDFLPFVIEETE